MISIKKRISAVFMAAALFGSTVSVFPGFFRDAALTASAEVFGAIRWSETSGTVAVTGYEAGMAEYILPAEIEGMPVTSVGGFYNCTALKRMVLPDTVTSIEEGAFESCTSLTTINIPNGVKSIERNTFYGCESLKSITIPDSVSDIESNAFAFSGITEIIVSANNESYSAESGVLYDKEKTTLIYCPPGKKGEYRIPSGITKIKEDAFSSCNDLTAVVIPESVTSIEQWAFYSCEKLASITIMNPDCDISSIDINKDICKIYGYSGSTAEDLAARYGLEFQSMGGSSGMDSAYDSYYDSTYNSSYDSYYDSYYDSAYEYTTMATTTYYETMTTMMYTTAAPQTAVRTEKKTSSSPMASGGQSSNVEGFITLIILVVGTVIVVKIIKKKKNNNSNNGNNSDNQQ